MHRNLWKRRNIWRYREGGGRRKVARSVLRIMSTTICLEPTPFLAAFGRPHPHWTHLDAVGRPYPPNRESSNIGWRRLFPLNPLALPTSPPSPPPPASPPSVHPEPVQTSYRHFAASRVETQMWSGHFDVDRILVRQFGAALGTS